MAETTLLSTMPRQKALLLSTCLVAFIASLTLALPPGAPWTNFVSKPGIIYFLFLILQNYLKKTIWLDVYSEK